jgi:hypothetical protein
MGGLCSARGEDEKYVQNSGGKPYWKIPFVRVGGR